MAATVRASSAGLDKIEYHRRMKGWNKNAKAWADAAHTSTATLSRLQKSQQIQTEAYKRILKAVGIEDWESTIQTATNRTNCENLSHLSTECWAFAFVGLVEHSMKELVESLLQHFCSHYGLCHHTWVPASGGEQVVISGQCHAGLEAGALEILKLVANCVSKLRCSPNIFPIISNSD